jgi:hypothetical protein
MTGRFNGWYGIFFYSKDDADEFLKTRHAINDIQKYGYLPSLVPVLLINEDPEPVLDELDVIALVVYLDEWYPFLIRADNRHIAKLVWLDNLENRIHDQFLRHDIKYAGVPGLSQLIRPGVLSVIIKEEPYYDEWCWWQLSLFLLHGKKMLSLCSFPCKFDL